MDLFQDKTILSVSRLTSLIKGLMEENFFQVWVEGEVSNLATPASGHCYFTLKDSQASLRCVMFRSSVQALKFSLRDGAQLILRGRISVYDQRGDYQMIVEYAEPQGLGALQAAFIQLKERLLAEGLFDAARKKDIPLLPRRIGVVTSATGAVFQDICTVLGRRHAGLPIVLYPVRVQGEHAAREIVAGIEAFNSYGNVDVLIVGRGGGSLEDLWPFNEEIVARAISRSSIPVISAVGHETDWTIADFVADLRAATPSAAAEIVSAGKQQLLENLLHLQARLEQAVSATLHAYRRRYAAADRALVDPTRVLGYLAQRTDDVSIRLHQAIQLLTSRLRSRINAASIALQRHDPSSILATRRGRLALAHVGLEQAITNGLDRRRQHLVQAITALESLSPLKTLARGYSIVERSSDQQVLTDTTSVRVGQDIRIRMYAGELACTVTGVTNDKR